VPNKKGWQSHITLPAGAEKRLKLKERS